MIERVWKCKIGGQADMLPMGADSPMRKAIRAAYLELTGCEPEFIFSGWAAKLTEGERAVVENREPSETHITARISKFLADHESGPTTCMSHELLREALKELYEHA